MVLGARPFLMKVVLLGVVVTLGPRGGWSQLGLQAAPVRALVGYFKLAGDLRVCFALARTRVFPLHTPCGPGFRFTRHLT